MVVQLTVCNRLREPVVINSASATGQPVPPQGSVQVTAELREGENGVATITLYLDPQR